MKVFAGIGAFVCPGNRRSPKKKIFTGFRALICPDTSVIKGLRRIWSVFLSQKWLRIQASGGGKSRPGEAKIFSGREAAPLPPYFPRL